MYANAACGWAEQCHIVPSPPRGGGTGRGVEHALLFDTCDPTNAASNSSRVCRRGEPRARCFVPPPSLSLPHKGGGNRGARTFATRAMCPRWTSRDVRALAPLQGEGVPPCRE